MYVATLLTFLYLRACIYNFICNFDHTHCKLPLCMGSSCLLFKLGELEQDRKLTLAD